MWVSECSARMLRLARAHHAQVSRLAKDEAEAVRTESTQRRLLGRLECCGECGIEPSSRFDLEREAEGAAEADKVRAHALLQLRQRWKLERRERGRGELSTKEGGTLASGRRGEEEASVCGEGVGSDELGESSGVRASHLDQRGLRRIRSARDEETEDADAAGQQCLEPGCLGGKVGGEAVEASDGAEWETVSLVHKTNQPPERRRRLRTADVAAEVEVRHCYVDPKRRSRCIGT